MPKSYIKASGFRAVKNNVFVTELDSGPRISVGGIIIPDDDMRERGIRPRWAKVWTVGPEVEDIKPGEWIFIEHGRWTPGIDIKMPEGLVRVWRVDYPAAVLCAAENDPREFFKTDFKKMPTNTLVNTRKKLVA